MKKIILVLLASLALVSCVERAEVDIINPDAEYLYFYGATCPHCQNLNKQVKELDLFSHISVEKREVYHSNGNRAVFSETAKKLGLKESDMSVPFVYDTVSWEYAVGVGPALALFQSRLWDIVSGSWSADSSTGSTLSASWSVQ